MEKIPPIIQVGNVLLSSEILTEKFCCDLDACKGACCVEGDAGAPVTMEEIAEIDVSAIVNDTVQTYQSIAITEEKSLSANIPEKVNMKAAETHIRQIATLLLDNAMKYCDEGGNINVTLQSKGKGIIFAVSNSYKEGANVDYAKFFDRFYREDQSHNVDKGGYGIGLSIAESITELYSGKINASWKDEMITFTCHLKCLKNI